MNKLCGGCALKFGNVDKLKGHRREEHKWGFNRLGYCAFCGRGFDNKFSFFDHLLMDHSNRWKEMDDKLEEKRGMGAQDLPVQLLLAETAYRDNRESYKVITVNQMIEEFGAQIDGLPNGGRQHGAVQDLGGLHVDVENREDVAVELRGRDVIDAGYDSDDSDRGLRIVEDDEEEEDAVEMAGQAGEELIANLSTSTHAAPAATSLIGSWLEDVTSGKLVLGQLASPYGGEATLSGGMLAEAHPDDELIDVTTVSSPLLETISIAAAIEMGTPAPMATVPTPLQVTIGGDAAQLAEAARPTDLAMRAEDKTATSMTSLHLDTSSTLLGQTPHFDAASRQTASLILPGAVLPTTPTALLTPPADAIAPRLPMRALLRDLTSRGRHSDLTVVTGSITSRLNTVDMEATRKRSLISQTTPPNTPLAIRGSGVSEQEMAKKKPRSQCEEHFEKFHLAALLSPTLRRRSPSVEIIESSSVVSTRGMPKKEAVDPQPFVIDPIMYDISDEALNAMMTPEDVESIKREVWGVVDREQPLPHSPTDYTPLNAWTESQRPPQVTVTEALMLTPDSSHHSGSGARFDEDQKSKRESTSPAPSSAASMISGVSNEDFLRAMMADPRAQAALADTAAKFQLNAQPLATASQPPASSVLARLLQPEPSDQPMYQAAQTQQQQQLWAEEKAKAEAMRHQQRTLQLMQPQQQGMRANQELSLKEALGHQQQQVQMQQSHSSQQTHQPISILPSYQQPTMQQAQSLQQARQQGISMSQPLSMQQLPQQQQQVQMQQHHSHSSHQAQQQGIPMNQQLLVQQLPTQQQQQVHSLHAQIAQQAQLMGMPMSQSNQQQIQQQHAQHRQQTQHREIPKNQPLQMQRMTVHSQQPVHQHLQVQLQQVPSQQHVQQVQAQQDRWLGGQPRATRPQLAVPPMTQPHVQYWQGAPLPPQQPAWLPALLPQQQQQQNAPLTAGQLTKLQIWTASEAVCFAFRNTEVPAACPLCGMVISGKCAAKRNHIMKYHYNMHYYWKNNREAGQMQRVLENHVGAYLGTYSNPRICLACRKVEFNSREPILAHIKTCAPVEYDVFLRGYIEIKTLVGTVLDREIDAVIERLIGA